MRNLIAAIDLGSTKIACAVGEKCRDKVKIIFYGEESSKGIKRGRVENMKQAYMALNQIIRQVEERLEAKLSAALVGISGQDIKCQSPEATQTLRDNPNEMISTDEVAKVTSQLYKTSLEDGYRVIYVVPQCYNVDNYMSVSDPVGMIGRSIVARYKLFIGKENSGRLINSTLTLAKIKPLEQILSPIASAKAILTDEDMELGCAVVDIGGGTTDVIIIQNDIIRHIGVIPFGGNSVTEDICGGINLTRRQAEQIKRSHGCCYAAYTDENQKICIKRIDGDREIQMKVLSRIIQARMTEILEAVYWHIEQSGFKNSLRGGVIFTGGGAQIQNLTLLASSLLGYPTRIACPTSYIIDPDSVPEAQTPTASTAVGMVLCGFQHQAEEAGFGNCLTFVEKPEQTTDQNNEQPENQAVTVKPEHKPALKNRIKKMFEGKLFSEASNEA